VIDQRRFTEIRDGRYASRTEVRRDQEAAEGFIIETEKNLPVGSSASWTGVVDMLRTQVGEAKAGLEREIAEVDRRAIALVNAKRDSLDAKLAVLKKEYDAAVASYNWQYNADQAEIVKAADTEKAAIREASGAQLEDLTQSLGQAEHALSDQNRVEGQRTQLEKMRDSARHLQKRWNQLDTAVKGLDRLKSEKLATLPIPGIEVRLGEKNLPEVYIEGVPWEHVNKSKQCKVAITIAAQALGELPLMVLDESEVLDADSMKLLIDAAKELGLQIIMARVESGADLQAVEA